MLSLDHVPACAPGAQPFAPRPRRLHLALPLLAAFAIACGSAEDGRDGPGATDDPSDGPGADGGPGTPPGPAGPACASGSLVKSEGLAFDGKTGEVTMGVAPELGLPKFTVEAWVRRDGVGETTNTGAGGLTYVPVIGKGRGENDQTVNNCNYALGFVDGRLGADFEDDVDGGNHPVVGKTEVMIGEWHHVAATYDGATWRLYLDGRLDAQRTVNATPRADSIQHFGIGTAYDSKGAPLGHLHGAVAEARVWNFARTEDEVRGSMNQRVEQAVGLVGRWSFDGPTGLEDTRGTRDGTGAGGLSPAAPGPALDMGKPPVIVEATPKTNTDLAPTDTSVEIGVTLTDDDTSAHVTTFNVREIGEAEDFSVVVLPDTQYYTVEANGFERYFYDQTKWVMDNRKAYNIKAVIHNGDLVNNGDQFEYQWTVANRAMSTLEVKSAELPDGLPWGIGLGNHDRDDSTRVDPGTTVRFNRQFGVARFEGRAYYGGHRTANNDDNWFTFNAGGLDFVVVNFRYLHEAPAKAVTDWARDVFARHPYAFGIANSHYILTGGGNFGPGGRGIYTALRDVPNLHLMTCGHVSGESKRADTFEGHTIQSMLADYQFLNRDTAAYRGGEGYLRIWEFSPASDELTVRTYSPTSKKFKPGAASEYTLKVDLSGVGGAFKAAATVDAASKTPKAKLDGLKPGTTYEWYATVTDCAHVVSSPRYRFRTPKAP